MSIDAEIKARDEVIEELTKETSSYQFGHDVMFCMHCDRDINNDSHRSDCVLLKAQKLLKLKGDKDGY